MYVFQQIKASKSHLVNIEVYIPTIIYLKSKNPDIWLDKRGGMVFN